MISTFLGSITGPARTQTNPFESNPLTFMRCLCSPEQRGGHWETRLPCQIILVAALMHAHMHTVERTQTNTHTHTECGLFTLFFLFPDVLCNIICIYFGCMSWLTLSVVICSRWVGGVRGGTCSSETLCSDWPRPRGGAGSCWCWARLMSRDRCWGKNS